LVCKNCNKQNDEESQFCSGCKESLCIAQKEARNKNDTYKLLTIIAIIAAALAVGILIFAVSNAKLPQKESTSSSTIYNEYVTIMNSANASVDSGNYAEAIEDYKEAIELDKTAESAYIGLANAYELSGKHADAVKTLESAYIELKSEKIQKRLTQLNNTSR
jgi:tetratricopeptide (TPR) repeat protein